MMMRSLAATLGLALMATCWAFSDGPDDNLTLKASQKEFLALEPILVVVKAPSGLTAGVPVEVGAKEGLSFDIKPAVKPRPNAKPLPQEAKTRGQAVKSRLVDLLEWHQFPAEGTFTVQAKLQSFTSTSITFTIRRPAKEDAEWGPVDRLHHMPWSNYVTDAFCGDTFDLVKRWPESKLTKYCHYWNGLHHQHKKEYDKAIESFRLVADKHADFVLASHAKQGIAECVVAKGK